MDTSDEHHESAIPQRPSPDPEATGTEPGGTDGSLHAKAVDDVEPRGVAASERTPGSETSQKWQTSSGFPDLNDGRLAAPSAKENWNQQVVTTPVSLKKVEANRCNGEKSHGPKTAQGKQHSSWNSTKHGLLGKRLLMTDRTRQVEWDHLLDSLRQDIEPLGALEELLVEKIAKSYWRLQMADGYEISMAKSAGDFFLTMDKMARYQTAIGRQLARDVADLKRLQRERKESDTPANDAAADEEGNEA